MLRQELLDTMCKKEEDGWEILITTYNLAQGDEKDRKFFRRIEWDVSLTAWFIDLYSNSTR